MSDEVLQFPLKTFIESRLIVAGEIVKELESIGPEAWEQVEVKHTKTGKPVRALPALMTLAIGFEQLGIRFHNYEKAKAFRPSPAPGEMHEPA